MRYAGHAMMNASFMRLVMAAVPFNGTSGTPLGTRFTPMVPLFYKHEQIGLGNLQVIESLWLFPKTFRTTYYVSATCNYKLLLQMFSYWTLKSTLGSKNSQLHFRDGETKLKEVKSLTSDHTGCKWQSQDLYSDQFGASKTSHLILCAGMPSQTERINSINLYDLHRVNIGSYVDGVCHSCQLLCQLRITLSTGLNRPDTNGLNMHEYIPSH